MTLNSPSNFQQLKLENITNLESPSQQNLNQEEPGQKCIECGEYKSLEDYYPHNKVRCKICVTKRSYSDVYKKIEKRNNLVRPKPYSKLCYDHDHVTGEFRGWICYGCNTGLGKLGDTIEGLEKAIAYLKRVYEDTV